MHNLALTSTPKTDAVHKWMKAHLPAYRSPRTGVVDEERLAIGCKVAIGFTSLKIAEYLRDRALGGKVWAMGDSEEAGIAKKGHWSRDEEIEPEVRTSKKQRGPTVISKGSESTFVEEDLSDFILGEETLEE